MKTYSALKRNSQKLRKEMTKEERHLWYDFLKGLPCTVNRQKTIGCFIVDFYKLVMVSLAADSFPRGSLVGGV